MSTDVNPVAADRVALPAGFVWGAATAAYQIEGSPRADGREPSIWDTFCERPGAIAGGDTGEIAAEHYTRMPDDVALMAGMGLTAYRFSVSWPRVVRADGTVNPAGLDFYDRLVDQLGARGIEPWLTLYHWDLPQSLQDAGGGWANRDTAYRFADLAELVHDRLADRVRTWTTLNEPWCSAFVGHAAGEHAPGLRDPRATVAAVHHLLLGHGLATTLLRERDPAARIGITLNLTRFRPADPARSQDVEAVRRLDGLQNRLFLDPLYHGRYPADLLADLAPYGFSDHIRDGDLPLIAAPVDLLGVNYYNDAVVGGPGSPLTEPPGAVTPYLGAEDVGFVRRDVPRTAMDWEVHADGLRATLVRVHEDYPDWPLYVTENGAAYDDVVGADGTIEDQERIDYLRDHLRACAAAIAAGADLRGYFVWSLLDNFEWAYGYAKRFGIVHVDYTTQRRTPKASARWYAQAIESNMV